MFLIFDLETTGLPKNYKLDFNHVDNWPHIVQMSWTLVNNDESNTIKDFIIKPKGYTIPTDSAVIHGISTELALSHGYNLKTVIKLFWEDLKRCDYVVAHNLHFDSNVLLANVIRNFKKSEVMIKEFHTKNMICTMKKTEAWCQIPPFKYERWKFPKLSELYHKLFAGEVMEGAHNSKWDVINLSKCFFKLLEMGLIEI